MSMGSSEQGRDAPAPAPKGFWAWANAHPGLTVLLGTLAVIGWALLSHSGGDSTTSPSGLSCDEIHARADRLYDRGDTMEALHLLAETEDECPLSPEADETVDTAGLTTDTVDYARWPSSQCYALRDMHEFLLCAEQTHAAESAAPTS